MKKSAFTLIEMLLYLAILGSTVFLLSSFINMVNAAKAKNIIISEVEQQGDSITYLIRQAVVNSVNINSPATSSSSTSLSLADPSALTNPTIFAISGDQMTIKEGTSTAINLNNSRVSASNLIFYNYSKTGTPGIITGEFTLGSKTITNRNEFSYSKKYSVTASLRN